MYYIIVLSKSQRTKPQHKIGTHGHVNHGNTTLTAAITATMALEEYAVVKQYS